MLETNEKILAIVHKDELENFIMSYKLEMVKTGKPKPSLRALCKKTKFGRRKLDKLIAVFGSANGLHQYLARNIDPEKGNLFQVLDEAVEEQRKALPDMSAKDRNDLIKILVELHKADKEQPQVSVNIDSFLKKDAEVIDV